MQYTLLQIATRFSEPFMNDVLVSDLADLGFESFETTQDEKTQETTVNAYIQTNLLNEAIVTDALRHFMFNGIISYIFEPCEDKDWNAEWESHFMKPIIIGEDCVIHSSFARDIPACRYDIIIDPKMAFGTGQHQTTSLMLEEILRTDMSGLRVLDMGCGTAVLAILASMCGAREVTAVDIDDWCTRNALENIEQNDIHNIRVLLGDAKVLYGQQFDVILANINRNILLNDMGAYAACLPAGGRLLLSGFYDSDVEILEEKAESLGLHLIAKHTKEQWCQLTMEKQS